MNRKSLPSLSHSLDNIRSIVPGGGSNPRPIHIVVNQHHGNGEVQTSNTLSTLGSQSPWPNIATPFSAQKKHQPTSIIDLEKLPGSHAFGLRTSQCDLCIKGFPSIRQLCKHLTCRPTLNINCPICMGGFRSHEKLERHLNKHMQLICYICLEAKCSKILLKAHIRSHKRHGIFTRIAFLKRNNPTSTRKRNIPVGRPSKSNSSNTFKPALVEKGFKYIKNKNYHKISGFFSLEKSTKNAPYTCTLCLRDFPRSDYLVQHTMSHSGYRPFRCSLCPEQSFRPGKIVEHFVRAHCKHEKMIPELYFDDNEKCIFTKLWTGSEDTTATLHSTKKDLSRVLIELPKTTKKSPSPLNTLKRLPHTAQTNPSPLNALKRLPQTAQKRPSPLNFVSSGNNCEESSDNSEETLSADEGEKVEEPHSCAICVTTFPSASMLEQHVTNLHSKSRICYSALGLQGYKYIKNRNYEKISNVFSSAKLQTGCPLICTICNRKYTRSENLMHHMMAHSGYKPFRCSLCRVGYFRPGRIVVHFVRTHHQHGKKKIIPELYFDEKEKCIYTRPWSGSKDTNTILHSAKKESIDMLIRQPKKKKKPLPHNALNILPQTVKKRPSLPKNVVSDSDEGSSKSEETLTADEDDCEEKPHVCMICTAVCFPSASKLEEHMTSLHSTSGIYKSAEGLKGYKYIKHKTYENISSIFSQVKLDNGDSHTCSICQMKFIRSENLVHHKMSHSGYRPFRCSLCRAGNFRPGKIVEHFIRAHCHNERRIPELYFDDKEKCIYTRLWTGPRNAPAIVHSTRKESAESLIRLSRMTKESPSPMNVLQDENDTEESCRYNSEENVTAEEEEWEEKPHICMICTAIFPRAHILEEHITKLHSPIF